VSTEYELAQEKTTHI